MSSTRVSQYGATMGQSIGDFVVVGSTLKIVRAGVVTEVAGPGTAVTAAGELDVPMATRADLDVGAMVTLGRARVGAVVRNVTAPRFSIASGSLTLQRQARVGVAVQTQPGALFHGVAATADADLTTSRTIMGDVRHVAGGVEAWLAQGRLGVRGGLSANTVGERRPAGSVGLSVRLTSAVYLHASKTAGRDRSRTGWSAGLALAF